MNGAERLHAAVGCIDERYLALADITEEEITRMSTRTKGVSRRKLVCTAILAAVVAVLLTVGAYAAGSGGAGMWTGYDAKNYKRLPSAAQCVRDVGYIPVLMDSFANGYAYSGGNVRVHQAYGAGMTLTEQTRGVCFEYEKDGDSVNFNQYVSFSDDLAMDGEPAAMVGDMEIYYSRRLYKIIPDGYKLTKRDIADRESGRVVFSYGDKDSAVKETVVTSAQWRKGDRYFILLQLDGALDEAELVDMACEAALRLVPTDT